MSDYKGIAYLQRKLAMKRPRVLLRYACYEQKQNARDKEGVAEQAVLRCNRKRESKAMCRQNSPSNQHSQNSAYAIFGYQLAVKLHCSSSFL